jgi:environmental stress-induced protein Ves
VVLTLRNRLPFTRVHSHAVAQKSSGAFFRVMARERCWKWLTRYRVALRAFQAVRATDVMVNVGGEVTISRGFGDGLKGYGLLILLVF